MNILVTDSAHLYGMQMTRLHFFTMNDFWGKPDMIAILFANVILIAVGIFVFISSYINFYKAQ